MEIILIAAAFVAGCLVWNYLGPVIKGWLHGKEAAAGGAIRSEIEKLKGKI